MTKEKCKPLKNYNNPKLLWRDDRIPIAQKFDDPYFSLDNGLEEVRHVFLNGNKLSNRLNNGFKIAELGFGTGLNFLSTLWLWRLKKQKGKIFHTSFEAFPLQRLRKGSKRKTARARATNHGEQAPREE